jgi:hypothetical protein
VNRQQHRVTLGVNNKQVNNTVEKKEKEKEPIYIVCKRHEEVGE